MPHIIIYSWQLLSPQLNTDPELSLSRGIFKNIHFSNLYKLVTRKVFSVVTSSNLLSFFYGEGRLRTVTFHFDPVLQQLVPKSLKSLSLSKSTVNGFIFELYIHIRLLLICKIYLCVHTRTYKIKIIFVDSN